MESPQINIIPVISLDIHQRLPVDKILFFNKHRGGPILKIEILMGSGFLKSASSGRMDRIMNY